MKRKVKRGKVRRSSLRANNKKKKFNWNILIWILLGLIVLGVIYYSINSITGGVITGKQTSNTPAIINLKDFLGNFGGGFWESWVSGKGFNNDSISKIFLLLMIWLILIMVFDGIFKGRNLIIINLLALIVAFLSTAYITPGDFFAILQSYSALGLTIASLVPLAVLLMLNYQAATSSDGKVQLMMLSWFGWIFFTLYSIYKLILFLVTLDLNAVPVDKAVVLGILAGVTLLAGFMMIFNNRITRWLTKQYTNTASEAARARIEKATRGIRHAEEFEEGVSGSHRRSSR